LENLAYNHKFIGSGDDNLLAIIDSGNSTMRLPKTHFDIFTAEVMS
jgi:hypothetical protein